MDLSTVLFVEQKKSPALVEAKHSKEDLSFLLTKQIRQCLASL